jgi:hypothetical protein
MPVATFAVIGDYGVDNGDELAVSNLVNSQNPEFILTVGDNTYGSRTQDNAIGKYYSYYIGSYKGNYGLGSETNHFFPAIGNHDWSDGGGVEAYLDYFTLPESSSGTERYYDFVQGPVHFFVLDSDVREPDGRTAYSDQARWLEAGLKSSDTPWQIVVMHEPPYSSGNHGPETALRWPYEEWGADAVLSGHEHSYERLIKDDNDDSVLIPYFVNGIGGASLRSFSSTVDPDSVVRYHNDHGTMLVKADDSTLTFELWSVSNGGSLIDTYSVSAEPPVDPPPGTHQILLQQGVNDYTGAHDTMLREGKPSTTYGTATNLSVDGHDGGGNNQVLLRFDGLFGPGGRIPQGARITEATLTLQTTDEGGGAEIHRMLTAWSDETATWESLEAGIQANGIEAVTEPDLVTGQQNTLEASTFDVTHSLQAWTSGADNHGWAFQALSNNGWDFSSSEGKAAPILTVTYSLDQTIVSNMTAGTEGGDWFL